MLYISCSTYTYAAMIVLTTLITSQIACVLGAILSSSPHFLKTDSEQKCSVELAVERGPHFTKVAADMFCSTCKAYNLNIGDMLLTLIKRNFINDRTMSH